MQKASIITVLATVLYLIVSTANAMAVSSSDFPVCANPQGDLIASYDSGVHGIVDDTGTYTGSDKVYKIDDEKLVQCFCADDGSGIQTNWFKASNLTDEEIESHKKQGWIVIPNGSLWGLDDAVYLAQNQSYACNGGSGGGSSDTASGDNGSGTVDSVSSSIGGSVLGLATTGSSLTLFGAFTTGLVSVFLSFFLKKKKETK